MKFMRKAPGKVNPDKIFDIVNILIMCILLFIFVWPLWFVIISSLSDPNEVWMGNVMLLPKGFSLVAYEELLKYKNIWIGYKNSILYTAVGTVINVILTICLAYPLARKDFRPRNFLMLYIMITMYFSGGLIPTYLVVKDLHIVNSFWAMIIPGAINTYNVIVTRTYFANNIPDSLLEAADLDGANDLQIFIRIAIPLSKPVIAVIALYYAVGHWNDYYNALIYINNIDLLPLQSFLKDLLLTSQQTLSDAGVGSAAEMEQKMRIAQTLKFSTIVAASMPMLVVYPFVQKFFIKGIMIGSVKG